MEEPIRKSALDRIRQIKSYNYHLCRLIFCAKITNDENIIQSFDALIKEKFAQHVTGLLLVYSNFVIHLVEAAENEVFRLCNEIFIVNADIITNIKCLYIQNDSKKRFFPKWYFKRMKDYTLKDDESETIEDSFENASNIYKTMILNLHKFYTELSNTFHSENYQNFIEQVDLISRNGHSNIPCKSNIEFVLKSCWGHDLATVAKNYCDLRYPCNFDDYCSVSKMIQEIKM